MPEPLEDGDPERLGDFWLAGRLGAGSQGVVYDAYGPDGSRVAIKAFHSLDGAPADAARMAREVKAARLVMSFCTARILEARLDGARPFIVTEFVDGVSLGSAVRGGRRFTEDELHRLAVGVATALTTIHEAGVVHRDLKPDNVLLGPDGPRVIDFGIARTLEMSLTPLGGLTGTPRYMAPEVIRGERAGAAADVFAWGAIMFFAATGRPAFDAEGIPAILHQVLTGRPDTDVLPERLRPLVAAALAKDPLDRPSARGTLSALLDGLLSGGLGLTAAGSEQAALLSRWEPVDPALGLVAEEAFGSLSEEDRELVPEVFLRLFTRGDDGDLAARVLPAAELLEGRDAAEADGFGRVLEAFGRLVDRRDGRLFLSRPAVARAWPRLREWIDQHHEGLPGHHQIRLAAQLWDLHQRRRADVLTGTRLQEALLWPTRYPKPRLNPLEQRFLSASARAQTRAVRRRQTLTGVLAVLLVVALASVAVVVQQRDSLARQRDEAVARDLAGRVSALRRSDPRSARLLSVAAWRIGGVPEARNALYDSYAQPEIGLFRSGASWGADQTLSSDGRTLAVVDGGTARIWDVDEQRLLASFPVKGDFKNESESVPSSLAISPDRSTLALVDSPGYHVRLWDVASGLQIGADIAHDTPGVVAFSPDGGLLSYGHEPAQLIDWRTRKPAEWAGRGIAGADAISPDGARAVVVQGGRTVLRDLVNDREIAPLRDLSDFSLGRSSNGVSFSRDGRFVGFELGEAKVVVYNARTGALVGDQAFTSFSRPAFSPDGRYAWIGDDLRRTSDGVSVFRYALGNDTATNSVRFTSDGRALRYAHDDGSVSSIDLTAFTRPQPLTQGADAAQFSSDGRTLVTFESRANQVRFWDVRTRRQAAAPLVVDTGRARQDEVFTDVGLALSADGRLLAVQQRNVRGADGILLWDLTTRSRIGTIRPRDFYCDGGVTFWLGLNRSLVVVCSPAAEPARLAVYDIDRLKEVRTIPEVGAIDVAAAPDGRTLLVGGVGLIDSATGQQAGGGSLDYDSVFAYRPDGGAVVAGRFGLAPALVDARTFQPVAPTLTGATELLSATFTPDGRVLAGSIDQNGRPLIRLWDGQTGRSLTGTPFAGHGSHILDLAFHEGSLHSFSADGVLQEWPITPDQTAEAICAESGAPLDHGEWKRLIPQIAYRKICP